MKQKLIYVSILFFIITSCKSTDSKYILNENFDSNELGWPEEETSSHIIEIQDGEYFVHSVTQDSTKLQTSVSPQRVWFLLKMPEYYQVSAHIRRMARVKPGEYGLMLYSATLTYRFALTDLGQVYVTEYDHNTEVEDSLMTGEYYSSNEIKRSGVEFRVLVNKKNIEFYLNDKYIGMAAIKTKQWDDIRLFTSSQSKIAIDHLRITELKKSADDRKPGD